ncbi:hypothetical protein CsSME_00003062 [Camellia sinensis var. sinensis]
MGFNKAYWSKPIHVTKPKRNREGIDVRGGQLWGTDVYTDDSDLVAVLMHTGYCRPTAAAPPPAIQELRATVRVLPPQDLRACIWWKWKMRFTRNISAKLVSNFCFGTLTHTP